MGITKPCIHLHPAPSTCLQPAVCNTLNSIWTKILHTIGQFPQISVEKLKVVHFDWKLRTWYIGGIDSKSKLRFLKFRPQNPILGNKFGPKNSKFSVLPENLVHIVSQDANSESRLRFLKFQLQNPFLGKFEAKNSKLSILSKNWYTWYLKDADLTGYHRVCCPFSKCE